MRLAKACCLAMVVALAAMAVVATAPAAAATEVVFCKANVENCKGENVAGYGFTATSEAKFDFGESKKVQCASTMTRGENEWVSTLSFSSCTEGCTVKANALPYFAGLSQPIAGNGKLSMVVTGLAFKCGTSECVYSGYASEQVTEGGSPAVVHIKKTLTEEAKSFFCPASIVWEADYKFTAPAYAVYVTHRGIEGPMFCSVNETPCPQASIQLFAEFQLAASSELVLGKFPGGSNITCTKSGFNLANYEFYVLGGQWNYKPSETSACSSPVYTGCKVSMPNPPYLGKLKPSGKGSGLIPILEWEGRVPTVNVECSSKGTPFNCVYAAPTGFTLEFTGGKPAILNTSIALNWKSGSMSLCSINVTLKATYETMGTNAFYLISS